MFKGHTILYIRGPRLIITVPENGFVANNAMSSADAILTERWTYLFKIANEISLDIAANVPYWRVNIWCADAHTHLAAICSITMGDNRITSHAHAPDNHRLQPVTPVEICWSYSPFLIVSEYINDLPLLWDYFLQQNLRSIRQSKTDVVSRVQCFKCKMYRW